MVFRKKKERNSHGLMALANETAKMATNMMVLDKTEAELDKEIEREANYRPTTKIGKARKKGEHILHTKYVLLAVVILNISDCLLVLGELMLDIKYVTDLLKKEIKHDEDFIGKMKELYPSDLEVIGPSDIETLETKLLSASINWQHHVNGYVTSTKHSILAPISALTKHRRKRASTGEAVDQAVFANGTEGNNGHEDGHAEGHEAHGHSIEEDIAHGLHKASITILGILVIETMFKVFCLGKELLQHKLECFDVVIVLASFAVDLAFLKGLQQFTVQDFVLILSFMVPWRIIRVVNSLVVAIMDHEHFRLILLYKQKKKIAAELQESKEDTKGLEACINALTKMCTYAGVPDRYVKAKLNMYRKVKAKSGNAIGAISSYAVGGEAMLKPFVKAEPAVNNTVIISIETTDTVNEVGNGEMNIEDPSETGQQETHVDYSTSLLNGGPKIKTMNDKRGWRSSISVKDHTTDSLGIVEQRPRSRSAVEPVTQPGDVSPAVRRLARGTATFITTINNDDVLPRRSRSASAAGRVESFLKEDTNSDHRVSFTTPVTVFDASEQKTSKNEKDE